MPEVSRISVLTSGSPQGSNVPVKFALALGGQWPPVSALRSNHADEFLGRRHRAVRQGDLERVNGGGKQRRVEVGPEPGHEEHHLRGDEHDHAVAQVQLHDGRVVAAVRLLDHVAPPHEHGEGDAGGAHQEHGRAAQAEQARTSIHRAHPDDQADRHDEGEHGADDRPRARVHEVIVVVLGMRVGHLLLLVPSLLGEVCSSPACCCVSPRAPGSAGIGLNV